MTSVSNAVRAYKRTSNEQEVQVSDILYGVNATKSKKIKEQKRCKTLDKGCVEIKKDVNQSSPQRISVDLRVRDCCECFVYKYMHELNVQ